MPAVLSYPSFCPPPSVSKGTLGSQRASGSCEWFTKDPLGDFRGCASTRLLAFTTTRPSSWRGRVASGAHVKKVIYRDPTPSHRTQFQEEKGIPCSMLDDRPIPMPGHRQPSALAWKRGRCWSRNWRNPGWRTRRPSTANVCADCEP